MYGGGGNNDAIVRFRQPNGEAVLDFRFWPVRDFILTGVNRPEAAYRDFRQRTFNVMFTPTAKQQ